MFATRITFRLDRSCLLVSYLLLAAAGCQRSADSTTSAGRESAPEILRQMAEVYRSAKTYEDVGELHILPNEGAEEQPQPFAVAFERPGKVRIHSLGAIAVADGTKLHAFTPSLGEQVLERSCEQGLTLDDFTSDEMLDQAMRGQLGAGLPQLMLLLDSDAITRLTADAKLIQLPDANHAGEACRRISLQGPAGTAVFWISATTHLLRKFEFPMNAMREQFPLKAVWAEFKAARVGGEISPTAFQMELPEGVKLVKKFVMPPPEAPPALLDRPASDFSFVDLNGKAVDRQSLTGKVVVLDLWATWCGWCFEGLPLLNQVYDRYKDNDRVVILAVCTDELAVSDAKVREAFEKQKLTIPIVRDLARQSEKAFDVRGLPTSVVIGSDGTIQDYHVGYDAKLAETLPPKLEKLLAGENLARQELEAYEKEKQAFEARLADVLVDRAAPADRSEEVARKAGDASPEQPK